LCLVHDPLLPPQFADPTEPLPLSASRFKS
jgi:hypothetical protein